MVIWHSIYDECDKGEMIISLQLLTSSNEIFYI